MAGEVVGIAQIDTLQGRRAVFGVYRRLDGGGVVAVKGRRCRIVGACRVGVGELSVRDRLDLLKRAVLIQADRLGVDDADLVVLQVKTERAILVAVIVMELHAAAAGESCLVQHQIDIFVARSRRDGLVQMRGTGIAQTPARSVLTEIAHPSAASVAVVQRICLRQHYRAVVPLTRTACVVIAKTNALYTDKAHLGRGHRVGRVVFPAPLIVVETPFVALVFVLCIVPVAQTLFPVEFAEINKLIFAVAAGFVGEFGDIFLRFCTRRYDLFIVV